MTDPLTSNEQDPQEDCICGGKGEVNIVGVGDYPCPDCISREFAEYRSAHETSREPLANWSWEGLDVWESSELRRPNSVMSDDDGEIPVVLLVDLQTRRAQETPAPQAPIAKLLVPDGVSAGAPLQVEMYAPGLPPGEHDLYCEQPTANEVPVSGSPGEILGCKCIMCEFHRSAEVIERERRAEKANVCTGCNSTPCICSELKANERQCNHSLNQGTTLVREGDKLTCSVCKVLWKDFGAIDKADELCPHGNVEANCAGCAENGEAPR